MSTSDATQPAATDYRSLAVFAGLITVVAFAGGSVSPTGDPDEWYETLNRPWFNPPNWVFPVAWTTLYAMIAAAGWLVYRATGSWTSAPVITWYVQAVLNAAWSFIFFGLESPYFGLIELIWLWFSIAVFIILAWPLSRIAALLFVPYLAWVTFAGALNYAIWQMN